MEWMVVGYFDFFDNLTNRFPRMKPTIPPLIVPNNMRLSLSIAVLVVRMYPTKANDAVQMMTRVFTMPLFPPSAPRKIPRGLPSPLHSRADP